MKKTLLAAAFFSLTTGAALATPALSWNVNELAIDAATGGSIVSTLGGIGASTQFTANGMSLVYEASITQGAFNALGVATFTETGRFQIGEYRTGYVPDGGSQGTAISSTLGNAYSLWGTFSITGTAQINGNQLNVTVGSGSMSTWIDTTAFSSESLADLDMNLLVGTASTATGGALLTNLGNNAAGNGSFEIIWSDFERADPFGLAYWPAPNPFHMNIDINSDVDGIAGAFNLGGTQAITGGQGNAYFAVPEPTSIALLGLGLVGLGFSSRKKKAA